MRSRSPISPMPQLRVDGIEKSGTRIPARRLFDPDVIEGGSGESRRRSDYDACPADYEFVAANCQGTGKPIGKLIRRHDQAHDDERLVRKIEEVAGMHQDPLALEQIRGQGLFGAGSGDAHDERPAALDRQQRARWMLAHERPGLPQVVRDSTTDLVPDDGALG